MSTQQALATAQPAGESSILDTIVAHTLLNADDEAYSIAKRGVSAFIEELIKPQNHGEPVKKRLVDRMIAEIDAKLSQQMDEILHHPDFQALEAAWKGLQLLVDRTNFLENIKIELLSVSRQDLLDDFEDSPEPLHQLFDEQLNPGAELTQALRLLDELHLQLAALHRESAPEQAAFKMVKLRMEGQQPLLGNVRDAAARLPLPLRGWVEAVADDSWRLLLEGAYGYVNQRYQSEVHGFYVKAIQRRYPFTAHAGSDVALGDFQAFFKDRGVIARFYEGYLRPFVSAEGGRYRLRGLDGRSLPLSRSFLDQLSKAQVIRQGFFNEDQGEWAVRFTLAPYSLDQAVSRATLRIGEQQLEYRHGPIVPMTFNWPSEAGNARSSLVLERGTDRPMGIEKNNGAWSWFRLMELMQSEPASGRAGQILKADLAGLRANYLLTSQRSPSPFQMTAWRSFRLPDQL